MNLTKEIKCCRCGQLKPIDQMNGYDPITGDTSQAYCLRLAECKSDESEKRMNEVADAMGDEHLRFNPTHKLIFATAALPKINDDKAFFDRLRITPFKTEPAPCATKACHYNNDGYGLHCKSKARSGGTFAPNCNQYTPGGLMPMEFDKCKICGESIRSRHQSVQIGGCHLHCFEEEIEVFKVSEKSDPAGTHFFGKDLSGVTSAIECIPAYEGCGLCIDKVTMPHGKYIHLPEFDGF